jgi:hypothetical protein
MPHTYLPSTMNGTRGIGSIEFPSVSSATAIGITFAIARNVLISFALNLQKLAHARLEAGVSAEGGALESGVQRELNLPPEVEREARVWHGSLFEANLPPGPHLETDPLIALPTTASMDVPPVTATYGALFSGTYQDHVHGASTPRRHPKAMNGPGVGFAGENTKEPTHHGPHNESEYLKSKIWYVS